MRMIACEEPLIFSASSSSSRAGREIDEALDTILAVFVVSAFKMRLSMRF
jgi:hypothetical protein